MSVTPVFLLSQPRAGSTFVQRVIAAHPRVSTVSEPWFLLPLFYSVREQGARAEYWHELAAQATQDFAAILPGGKKDYLEEVADLGRRLYSAAAAEGSTHFLDKTPHYHFIAADLIAAFSDARFVILWRNPLAVAASLLRTFRAGRFEPQLFGSALYAALDNLTEAQAMAGDRGISVRYESLAGGGAAEWERLFAHIGLRFDTAQLESFGSVSLQGRYGDPTMRGPDEPVHVPSDGWREVFAGAVRRRWARRYLEWIGTRRLARMGYGLGPLLDDLDSLPAKPFRAPADAARFAGAGIAAARRRRALRVPDSPRPVGREWQAG